MSSRSRTGFDVAIVGGNHTGLALALSLARLAGPELRVAIVERAALPSLGAARSDPRAFAIAAASQRLLQSIGAWDAIAAVAEPVRAIDITDTALADAIRPVLLSYDTHLDGARPATHIVEAELLREALLAAAVSHAGITLVSAADVTGFTAEDGSATLTLATGASIDAALVVAADGTNSPLRRLAGIMTVGWSTAQTGIVATVTHERPHQGRAVQHFLPAGPFAMLPLRGNRSCITWTEEAEAGRSLVAGDDRAFLAAIEQRFGGKLGPLALDGPRACWPLEHRLARAMVAPRLALVGDAARTVHPLAGQGLNLALRDVAALAEVVVDALRVGLDAGDATALEHYQRWRRFDSVSAAAAFGSLNALFSNDSTLLRTARDLGLGLVERVPGLKHLLVTEAAGLTGDLPRLMRQAAA